MPGESNSVRGASYRVVSAPIPDMMEAWVPPVGPPDEALTQQLEAMIDGEVFRAGEALAPFGIRWIISLGDTPFEAVFEGQLDLVPLGASEGLALTTEATQPVRAETVQGQVPWRRAPFGYEGTATPARVYVAEAGHQNWGMDWAQSGWANEVVGSAGEIRFNELPNRRTQAFVALAVFVVLLVGSAAGRRIR